MKQYRKREIIKCNHYNGDGYSYKVQGQEFLLCSQCEMELLAEMKKQEVIENKCQMLVNVLFEKDIEKLQEVRV